MQNAPEDRDIDKYGEHAGFRRLVHVQPGRGVVDKHPPARCRPPSARSVETQAGGKEAARVPEACVAGLDVDREPQSVCLPPPSTDLDTTGLTGWRHITSLLPGVGRPPSSPGGFAWQRLKRRLHKPLVPSVPSRRSHSRTTNGRLCANTCCQGCRVSGSVPRAPFHGNWTQAAVVVASDGREWACGCSAGWLWPVSCLVSVRWGDTGWEGHRTQDTRERQREVEEGQLPPAPSREIPMPSRPTMTWSGWLSHGLRPYLAPPRYLEPTRCEGTF